MAVYRAYYGDALYGQDTYGLSGSITDGAAIVTPSATVAVSAVRVISFDAAITPSASVTSSGQVIKLGAAGITPSASVTSSADRIIGGAASTTTSSATTSAGIIVKDGAASVTTAGVVVSIAETYAETDGYRDGYGLRTYGTFVYGENYSIEEASATITASATAVSAGQRIAIGSAAITPSSTFVSNGVIDVVGRANVALSSSVDISYNRVRLMSATDTASLTVNVLSRYKWLDADDPTTIWTDATDPTNTWTEADYLERAA